MVRSHLPTARAVAFTLGLLAGFPGPTHAETKSIDLFQSAFLPQSVRIQVGDEVVWVWQKGTHTIASGRPDGEPGSPDEPGKLFEAVVDESHPELRYTFTEPRDGGYPFFCRQHPEQLGFVEIDRGEVSHRVAVVDNVFNPEDLYVFSGDTVVWEHEPMEGFHTVTSGLSSDPADRPGELFDEESSDALPTFSYQYLEGGDFPYFCRPHEHMGMRGRIHVQEKFVRGDASGEGTVDISDAVSVLNYLFLGGQARCCSDALDANDDGAIDIGDPVFALNFLFLGGARIPAPYPLPGGDRTEDTLLCCIGDR